MAKDTFYFSHDYNARNDPKLQKVLMRLGQEGKGVYWDLVEMLFEEGGKLLLSECESYAFALRTNETCIARLLKEFDLFEFDDEYFWSNSVNRRLEERNIKSEKARSSALNRWKNANAQNSDANAVVVESEGNAIKERKGNKRKGKENKEGNISSTEVSDGIYKDCMGIYNEFVLNLTGVGAKIDGAQGNAMKAIIAYLKTQVKNKENLSAEVPNAFKYILTNSKKWDSFTQNRITLTQINSNLINIINAIKNGTADSTKKQPQSQYAS